MTNRRNDPNTRTPVQEHRGPCARAWLRVAALSVWVGLTACSNGPTAHAPVAGTPTDAAPREDEPFIIVLGIAQDGGVPQAGAFGEPGWTDPSRRRLVASLGLVDPATHSRWLFDATPDFRTQLWHLHAAAPDSPAPNEPPLSGIFLTHAHIGHYTGLMFLGHESLGARGVPVYAMPRMREFLSTNGPWSQLVQYHNITLRDLDADRPVALTLSLSATPILVPHRQEFSEVVGFRIDGPAPRGRRVLFIPDIDSWSAWDGQGTRLESMLASVDVAYLDGTFYANGEIPGRDMTGFPHPFITATMDRLAGLPAAERGKVRFIHLNHTNPALWPDSPARREIERRGYGVAEELERIGLNPLTKEGRSDNVVPRQGPP